MNVKRFTFSLLVLTLAIFLVMSPDLHCKGLFSSDKVYDSLELFTDVLTLVKKNYVTEVSSKDLITNALKGMLQALDPHSQFLDADMYKEMQIETEGKFGGLGIEITVKGKFITVISPIQGSPAEKAGILPGDIVVKIGDESTEGITILEAVKKLRGPTGTSVKLSILRPQSNEIKDYTLTREIIELKSVPDFRVIGENIGYICVSQFQDGTARDFGQALDDLMKKGVQALIIDLRNNPGGLLNEAVAVAEMFVQPGQMIVYTRGRNADQNMDYIAQKNGTRRCALPLAVLVNRGSASGSEIVAGALQDWKRAVIIGENTFGKASVQSVVPVRDGCAVRLTIAKYFTPKGRSIDANGITPDISSIFAQPEDQPVAEEPPAEEAAPEKDKAAAPAKDGKQEAAAKDEEAYRVEQDPQVLEAINILNGIRIYSSSLSGSPEAKEPAAAAKPAK